MCPTQRPPPTARRIKSLRVRLTCLTQQETWTARHNESLRVRHNKALHARRNNRLRTRHNKKHVPDPAKTYVPDTQCHTQQKTYVPRTHQTTGAWQRPTCMPDHIPRGARNPHLAYVSGACPPRMLAYVGRACTWRMSKRRMLAHGQRRMSKRPN